MITSWICDFLLKEKVLIFVQKTDLFFLLLIYHFEIDLCYHLFLVLLGFGLPISAAINIIYNIYKYSYVPIFLYVYSLKNTYCINMSLIACGIFLNKFFCFSDKQSIIELEFFCLFTIDN